MVNELKEICERLEGFSVDKIRWLVQYAEKQGDGTWKIEVKKVEPEAKNEDNK